MSERIIVSTKDEKVRGVKRISGYSGAGYYSFYGIPYGQPPTNTLRYKDPIKAKPWKDIYDGTIEKPGCFQYAAQNYRILGTDDCLFNNIHTSELPNKTTRLRAVVAFIHPGAFLFGSPNETDFGMTRFIMHHDIVYVGMAYRLHILGFMNLGIKECPGNQGIKDVILSLRWIQDNIRYFGGDPENVTLMESSSGAAIIHILMLLPLARGLFHKAVIMGSYIFDPTHHILNSNEKLAFKIATSLRYHGNIDDRKKLLSFIKKLDPMLLISPQRKFMKEIFGNEPIMLPTGIFLPTIDVGENPVLPKFPRDLIQSTLQIPLIIGYSDLESALGFSRAYNEKVTIKGKRQMTRDTGTLRQCSINKFTSTLRQNSWGWGIHLKDEDLERIKKQIELFYSQGKPIEKAALTTMIDIQSGAMISDLYDTLINVIASTPESPVYLYRFQYESDMRTMKSILLSQFDERLEGTFHGDDFYYWCNTMDPPTDKSKKMVETFTKLICTFAKTSNPNFEDLRVHWKPTKPDAPCYLSINEDLQMVDGQLHSEKYEFWDNIKKQFQNKY